MKRHGGRRFPSRRRAAVQQMTGSSASSARSCAASNGNRRVRDRGRSRRHRGVAHARKQRPPPRVHVGGSPGRRGLEVGPAKNEQARPPAARQDAVGTARANPFEVAARLSSTSQAYAGAVTGGRANQKRSPARGAGDGRAKGALNRESKTPRSQWVFLTVFSKKCAHPHVP